jgi:hypothetical protein
MRLTNVRPTHQGAPVAQLFRLGCAGVAVIAIAALTSIGLYAVVAGGVLFGAPGARSTPVAVPFLVTIQAAPITPTVVPIPSSTPMPSSLIPGLAQAPAPALVPPSPAASTVEGRPMTTAAPSSSTPVAAVLTPSPYGAASPRVEGPATPAQAELGHQAIHEGLMLEIVEIEPGWQARAADGALIRGRDGLDLLTIHVRLVNRTAELRYAADSDIVLVADDGARFAPRQVPPLREPHLLTLPVPPGDGVRGWLTYDVPAGSTPRRLQWSPTRPDRPRAEATFMLTLP